VLGLARGFSLTNYARNDCLLRARFVDVLLYLDGENLGLSHLTVQELDDPSQARRNRVRYEDESQLARSQVRPNVSQ
jgi:hypothetical protein